MSSSTSTAPTAMLRSNGALIVLLLACAGAALVSHGAFLRPSNLATVLFQASIIGVLALGQMLVIIAGGIDLSAVAILVLAATIMGGAGSAQQAKLMLSGNLPYIGFWPALIAGFAVAALAGLANGLVITRLRIPAFIATLASAMLISGIVLILTGGAPISYPDPFYLAFGQTILLGLAAPVWIPLVLAPAVGWVLARRAFGRKLYALGANESAARHTGLSPDRIRLVIYVLSGFFAGLGGFMLLARSGSVSYTSGDNLMLTALASVVVGGIALRGGSGGVRHAVAGVLLLTVLGNTMNIMMISPHIQNVVNGIVILLAVSLYGIFEART